jgi:hypothetical protein
MDLKDESVPDPCVSPPPPTSSPERVTPALSIKWSIPTRIIDSFRRDPSQHVSAAGEIVDLKLAHGHDDSYDVKSLTRKLKTRHLQMIAIGGSIGKLFPFSQRKPYRQGEYRNWIICWIGKSACGWRPCLFTYRIQSYQLHVVLYCVRFGRVELSFPYCGQFQCFCD